MANKPDKAEAVQPTEGAATPPAWPRPRPTRFQDMTDEAILALPRLDPDDRFLVRALRGLRRI